MVKILTHCPLCEYRLEVTELTCSHCRTTVRSRFATCRFCDLSEEHLRFIELFLRSEGNLSRVGAVLGISYPTVRNKLTAAIQALGLDREDVEPDLVNKTVAKVPMASIEPNRVVVALSPEETQRRRSLLDGLEEGTLSLEDVVEELRGLHK